MMRGLKILISLILLVPALADASPRKGRWSEEKANEWYYSQDWAVGCDYVVSDAINQIEMWQESTFNPELIDRELAVAQDLGFNTIRLFLHDLVYEADPKGFKQRVARVLDICESHGIKVVMTFFTNGGKFDGIALGEQPGPTPGIHNPEWRQTPGAAAVNDPAQWPRLEKYVKDILRTFRKDKRIYCWCLYNEPENDNRGANSLPLMRETFRWGWEVNPDQPLTAPYASLMANDDRSNLAVWGFLSENCDIMSFHCYNPVNVLMDKYITPLKKMNRPIICTECVGRPANTLFDMYAICRKENIGVLSFGLFDSRMQCKFHWDSKKGAKEPKVWFHDIFRADGAPYDQKEIDFIKAITADKKMVRGQLPKTMMVDRFDTKGRNRRVCMKPFSVTPDTLIFRISAEELSGLKRIVLSPDFISADIEAEGSIVMPDGHEWGFGYKDDKSYTSAASAGSEIKVRMPSASYDACVTGCEGAVSASAIRLAQKHCTRYIIDVADAVKRGTLSDVEIIYVTR